MIHRYEDGEPAAELLERRWFAALRAAQGMRAECEVLLGVMELAEDAWQRTRTRLVELETLRDALGEQLSAIEGQQRLIAHDAVRPVAMSAA
jgi:hypothetical protein